MKKYFSKIFTTIALAFMLTLLFHSASNATTTITPTRLSNADSSAEQVRSYALSIPAGTFSSTYPVIIAEKGYYTLDISALGLPSLVRMQLYSDPACKMKVGYGRFFNSSGLSAQANIYIATKGTYYVNIGQTNKAYTSNVNLKIYYHSSENKDLKNNVWTGSYAKTADTTIYHKIVVPQSGFLRIDGFTRQNSDKKPLYKVALYNSSKKAISSTSTLNEASNYSNYYGIKKGTYYIGVTDYGLYNLKYTFTASTDKNNSSKKKASSLKKSKTAKGLFVAGESGSKADWYKIKIPKKRKVKFSVKAYANGALNVQLIAKTKNRIYYNKSHSFSSTATSKSFSKTLPKGTYYIKVTKTGKSKTISGFYSLQWK